MTINWDKVREDFPILDRKVNGEPLIYLDNAATTQKPKIVIEAIKNYYENYNANVYRSVHTLSEEATASYEASRRKVSSFINAKETKEIIFTKGTTDSLNQLARSLSQELQAGDEILLTYMEHHSNIIPWQQAAKAKGAELVYVSLTEDGRLDLEDFKKKLTNQTKIVTFTHVSNTLGIINPVKELTKLAHEKDAVVIVDGAQATPHLKINVVDLDVDFYAFSGHKMLGPSGIGVLYGKKNLLEKMEPAEFGGEMIQQVFEEESTWAALPHKFEAGTPNMAGAIGLGAAIDYLSEIGMEKIVEYEADLVAYLIESLSALPDLKVYGSTAIENRTGVVSFSLEGIHPHDLATALDMRGIAIRAGHHCTQLLMKQLQVIATSRISLSFYNTKEEIDFTIKALTEAREYFNL